MTRCVPESNPNHAYSLVYRIYPLFIPPCINCMSEQPNINSAHSGFLIQSNFGISQANLEVVVTRSQNGFAHYSRNDISPFKWSGPENVESNYDVNSSLSLVQSDYGEKGYFDVVGRVNDHLVHFFREDFAPFHWKGPFYVPNSGGSSGNPALVQGNFLGSDKAHKNFELVVPRLDSGFNHYWVERKVEINFVTMPIPGMGSFYNINIPIPKLKYQWHGPFPIAVDRGKIDAISLIQSNFKSGFNTPGNLDVIARQGDHLVYFWREDYSPFAWHGPFNIPNSTESTGNPSFVQSNFGDIRHGNYELVVPRVDGGFNFFWKDSNLKLTTIRPGLEAYRPFYEDNSTWHGPYVVGAGKGKVNAISIIQSTIFVLVKMAIWK